MGMGAAASDVTEADQTAVRVKSRTRFVLGVGCFVLLVMFVIELHVLPRRSISSMVAGLLLLGGSAVVLISVTSLVVLARRRPDLRRRDFWCAVGVGLVASLPFARVVVSLVLP